MKSKIFHSLMAVYCCVICIGCTRLEIPEHSKKLINKLTFRYITTWNVVIQFVFSTGCLIHDFSDIFKVPECSKRKLQFWLDFLFYSFVGPNNLMVAIAFWSMYNYDTTAVFDASVANVVPGWLNNLLHTFIAFLPFLEILFVERKLPSFKLSLLTYSIILTCYKINIVSLYLTDGIWIYPIFSWLTNLQKCMLICYFFIEGLVSQLVIRYAKLLFDGIVLNKHNTDVKEKVH